MRLGAEPDVPLHARALLEALRAAVDTELTTHQRRVFIALVVESVPLDALATELGTSRGAVYKTMFDARRKLRRHLEAHGYLGAGNEGDHDG